ncbi:MAG: PrsW family intramembrane metalloprotease [Oscillospiraceae bacterium]|nr:PrsW family intramembrane metalloprotease [Oscillospiraceae bacterium]
MIKIYKADRLEKEPVGLLLSLVALGVLSTSIAGLSEEIGAAVLQSLIPPESLLYKAIVYFVIVGISEEGFKYLLLKIRTWNSPHFNCSFDGVVYSVFVSLGFALWENISYVLQYGLGTAIARAITAVPGHACFGVYMGVWYGIAKRYANAGLTADARRARRNGLITAVLLHGMYDFIASMQNDLMSILFLVFVAWMFTRTIQLVKQASAEDGPLYAAVTNGSDYTEI